MLYVFLFFFFFFFFSFYLFLLHSCKVFNCSFFFLLFVKFSIVPLFDMDKLLISHFWLENLKTVHSYFPNLELDNFDLNAKFCTFAVLEYNFKIVHFSEANFLNYMYILNTNIYVSGTP